ncbi:MAG: hypothetical protein P8J29_10540 [Rhodospirillales bacterium]|nr:hypothetical protein [Rhodospirillales bacterium]
MEGDLTGQLKRHLAMIAHIQAVNAPGRHEPDCGELNHRPFSQTLDRMGCGGWVVGEYIPVDSRPGGTSKGLAWLKEWGAGINISVSDMAQSETGEITQIRLDGSRCMSSVGVHRPADRARSSTG